MPSIKTMAVVTAAADIVLCGLLSNGFIIAVMITAWAKSRNLAACEQLFLSLGISNIWSPTLQIVNLFTFDIIRTFKRSLILQLYCSFSVYVVIVRYWLTAWLCVFYCIKILNSTHPFILWWKMRISRLVPWLIVGSCVISFLVSQAVILVFFQHFQNNGTANITNLIQEKNWEEAQNSSVLSFFIVGSGCPLLIVFLCSILIVSSLCRHICRMVRKGSNFKSLRTGALIKAAGTVLSLLLLYISYYVSQTLGMSVMYQKEKTSFYVAFIVMWMYSPVQAAILVLSNPKLKQTVFQILTRTKSYFSMVQLDTFFPVHVIRAGAKVLPAK